ADPIVVLVVVLLGTTVVVVEVAEAHVKASRSASTKGVAAELLTATSTTRVPGPGTVTRNEPQMRGVADGGETSSARLPPGGSRVTEAPPQRVRVVVKAARIASTAAGSSASGPGSLDSTTRATSPGAQGGVPITIGLAFRQ